LLDDLIDAVAKSVKYDSKITDTRTKIEQAKRISQRISDVLKERGFELYIPTETLSDALDERNLPGEPERHVFDCDTGSFIFLTVAENLGAPLSLVEITLPSGSGHNYVRWRIDDRTSLDWDLNGQAECITPPNLANDEGRSMSRTETLGYAFTLRAALWRGHGQYANAIADYREAMRLYPQSPDPYNNFAWTIATREIPDRKLLQNDALVAAEQAIIISRRPNYLDTLACVNALMGNFSQAIKYQSEALAEDPRNDSFQERLALFKIQKDCTGAK
jgi:tetratricopeptide (TPR) repeat protein